MKKSKKTDLTLRRKVLNDSILVAVVLTLVLGGLWIFRLTGSPGDRAVVLVDGREIASYPLSEELQTVIGNGEETNTLVICEGKASVTEASCPDGICAEHRPISKVGETIVCLPHKVVIKVVSSSENDVDIVT